MLVKYQAWHLAGYESPPKDARMSTLDEGLMATLTQEERDAMKEDDATTESVVTNDRPIDEESGVEAQRNEVVSTGTVPQAADASLVDIKSEQAIDSRQAIEVI